MARRLALSPDLARAVERARIGAEAAGELLAPPTETPRSPLSPEVRAVVAEWIDSGAYDRAVAELTAADPDLATQ